NSRSSRASCGETKREAAGFSPSPGTPGEGWGGGCVEQASFATGPLPNPPPEYRGRESERTAGGADSRRSTGGLIATSSCENANQSRRYVSSVRQKRHISSGFRLGFARIGLWGSIRSVISIVAPVLAMATIIR